MAHAIINGGPDQVAGHGGVRRDRYLESSCISSLAVTIAKSQRLGNSRRQKEQFEGLGNLIDLAVSEGLLLVAS